MFSSAKFLETARDGVLSLLYPTSCRVCGTLIETWDDGIACASCWTSSAWSASLALCAKCGLPLAPFSDRDSFLDNRCGTCEQMAFSCARACGPYQGAWRETVLWLKTHPQIAPRIRRSLSSALESLCEATPVDSVVPVPLHPERERARGFNQAEVIGRALTNTVGLRLDTASLTRVRPTMPHRAGMDASERARSLERAFRVRAPRLIAGRAILVVDDVMTTAATAHEIAVTLLDAGARAVSLMTLARVTCAPRGTRPDIFNE